MGNSHSKHRALLSAAASPTWKSLLHGTFNQADTRYFSARTRGVQCLATATIAAFVSRTLAPSTWTTETIDDLLFMGDVYYQEVVLLLAEGDLDPSGCLEIRQLARASNYWTGLRLEITEIEQPCILDPPAGFASDAVDLSVIKTLNDFFTNYERGIILANGYGRAIFKAQKKPKKPGKSKKKKKVLYYLYDPHSINDAGFKSATGSHGAALMSFRTIADLAKHFERLVRSTWPIRMDPLMDGQRKVVEVAALEWFAEEEN